MIAIHEISDIKIARSIKSEKNDGGGVNRSVADTTPLLTAYPETHTPAENIGKVDKRMMRLTFVEQMTIPDRAFLN